MKHRPSVAHRHRWDSTRFFRKKGLVSKTGCRQNLKPNPLIFCKTGILRKDRGQQSSSSTACPLTRPPQRSSLSSRAASPLRRRVRYPGLSLSSLVLSLCFSISPSLSMSLARSISLCLSLSLSLSLFISPFFSSLALCLSRSLSLSVPLAVSLFLCLSFSLSRSLAASRFWHSRPRVQG